MIIKDAIKLLLTRSFKYIGCNQPDIAIFFKPINANSVDVCILSDNTGNYQYTPFQLATIFKEVEKKFIFNGYRDINCHCIVFSKNISKDRVFTDSNLNFWLVDTLYNRVIIYDNQPDDYYHLKYDLEKSLSLPDNNTKLRNLKFPFVTCIFIIINILIFFAIEMVSSTQNTQFMAEHGALSWQFLFEGKEYYRLITSMFLHFGSEHLINNMITLAVVGNEVEKIIGHGKFIIIYLLSGIGAGILSANYNMNIKPNEMIISAGASGAIFGIIGSLLVISLVYKSLLKQLKPINIAFIIILSIFNGFQSMEIDNIAHIGGLMFGIIITFISCLYTKNVIK